MIEVNKLYLIIDGKHLLKDISFKLYDNDNLVILGRSGSGKTLLIKTLLGLYTPDSGDVFIDGISINNSDADAIKTLRNSFAMVFQNAALLDSFTVRQNIALPLYERGEHDINAIDSRVEECLSIIGLEHTANLYPSELSGGMRKRIGIARALAYNPKYIVFDEPVSGLDPITSDEVLYYITKIIDAKSATVITITHDISNLSRIGNEVLFIDSGKLVYSGSMDNLCSCNSPIVKQYLSKI